MNQHLDFSGLPKCGICGASVIAYAKEMRTPGSDSMTETVVFACDAGYTREVKVDFKTPLPDGRFTPYAGFSSHGWERTGISCKNAELVVQMMREDAATGKVGGA